MTLVISVVIPSYNAAAFIRETIDSVINQDYPEVQCIVVDGGSDDGTRDILKKYEGRLEWLSEKDRGQSDAINKGLQLAKGEIVTYLNADDVYESGCLRKVADAFMRNPESRWVYGKCRVIDEHGVEIRKLITWYHDFWQRRYSYNRLLVVDFISQPSVFWRRELVEEFGLFDVDEHLAMEYDFWLRIGAKYRPVFIDECLSRFRLHPVSKSATGFSAAAKNALRVARRAAVAQKRGFLVPLQYLNYFAVVSVYSVLNLASRIRTDNGG